ncbi:hypothetical protein F5Y14DRAFT_401376 [Nemania sp. NC0429]|nr:hypothetical protein F5Y14DRAFT_401376 [Nemania sp. NC0429]
MLVTSSMVSCITLSILCGIGTAGRACTHARAATTAILMRIVNSCSLSISFVLLSWDL